MQNNFKRLFPYIINFLAAIAVATLIIFFFTPKSSHTSLKIGLINMQRVRDQAEPFIQWQKLLQEESSKAQERFQTLEATLVKEYESLQEDQQKKKFQPEILAIRKQKLDKKAQELENQLQKERESLRHQFDKWLLSVESTLDKIIQDYSKAAGIDLLLNTQFKDMYIALAGDNSLNHTESIIKKLNETVKNIKELP